MEHHSMLQEYGISWAVLHRLTIQFFQFQTLAAHYNVIKPVSPKKYKKLSCC